jgi:hypothetical protein
MSRSLSGFLPLAPVCSKILGLGQGRWLNKTRRNFNIKSLKIAMHKIRYLLNNFNGTLYRNEEKEANCISNLASLIKSFKAKTTFRVVVKK